ncbi:MAG: ABC transporter permease [Bacillota bacterium]
MKAFSTMVKTELKLSLRGMDMLIFAVAMPVIVVIILGIIFGSKPAFEGAAYTFLEQSFGAVASIGICAAGVMGLPLAVADYRHKKILKRYKVTPVSPSMILLAQITVNAIQSAASLVLVYFASSIFFGYRMNGSLAAFLGAYLLVMLSIYSIGMMVAGVAPNIKAANILCVIIYFPMLIFSGATLPYEVMPPVLQRIADVMPLTQGIKLLKGTSLGLPVGDILIPIAFMLILAAFCIGLSVKFFRWE